MDPGFRSPLVDSFRRGEVARDVRVRAAQGDMASDAHEQLALLVLLSDDPDDEVRATANETLDLLPSAALDDYLARVDVPAAIRAFFEARRVAAGDPPPPADPDVPAEAASEDDDTEPEEESSDPNVLSLLPIKEKVKLAMKGTREQRAQLIRDPNRMVSSAVLSSPKLSEAEVEAFTKMGNVSEETLRTIGHNRSWVKNYGIVLGLTKNAKTPLAMSMQLMHRLNEKDLKMLSVDRNVPEALRIAARKAILKAMK
jgi:hypothetical protein